MSELNDYITAFDKLAKRFSEMEGWECRQEKGNAYLHVSKPNWQDENMNGIHLETYVMDDQLQMGYAPVCIHCEGGFPKQREFMLFFIEQARPLIESWLGYEIKGPKGCSVCEIMVPIKSTADETIDDLATELIRLQSLTSMIDQTIEDVLAM